MKVSYLAGMNISASGLQAQRAVMDAAAENLANAHTTRTETGEPYRRKIASLSQEPSSFAAALPAEENGQALSLLRTDPAHLGPSERGAATRVTVPGGVQASVTEDLSDFPQIYDPSHPDADENGMVRLPNVETAREMVNLMAAARAYEANVAALQASRKLAEASLNLAR